MQPFRYSIRSLLYITAALALLLTFGPRIYEWWFAVPPVPLADAVVSFNTRSVRDPVGRYEPSITEAEIVASIRAQLPTLPASNEVKGIYSDIVRTKLLPHGASLQSMRGWELKDRTFYTVWWINLDIPTGKTAGFSLRIRENNQPIAKPKDEPKLDRRNLSWNPKSPQ